MPLEILKPGLLSTIQDLGRYGYQKDGIIVSGAMDVVAHRIANILVGSPEDAATIEATLIGPTLRFTTPALIAITGGNLSPEINGEAMGMWRPVYAAAGSILSFQKPVTGCRTYVAVAGGFAIPEVLKSQSTYLRAGLGGYQGRALQTGDLIPLNEPADTIPEELKLQQNHTSFTQTTWALAPQLYYTSEEQPTIRAVHGPEYDLFSETSKTDIWEKEFQVTMQSDRMGYRLSGATLALSEPAELISSAVTFGTIQVPAEGNPIILMADHQTTGGYPRIAQVITADLPKLAQVQPGKIIRFQEVTLEQAQQLYIQQELNIQKIKWAVHNKTHHTS
ncbi:biotin-dependent carboxyltransferase family protein [Pontibacter vulgaris]|uniref:5-oxoprolinase subunit C family protein n=1 Tax=Pontibacter vulgaris TaxID=2905679 RepID=UPI001FA7D947|nr:biotin-dependent carboxyltransferase family protein [Pontibacter vulgaris]